MKVRAKHKMQFAGRTLRAGDELEINDHDAKSLIEQGHVEPVAAAAGATVDPAADRPGGEDGEEEESK